MSDQARPETARAEKERRRMAAISGIEDEALLVQLQEIGYTSETIQLLHLVPLVAAIWAQGGVSPRERDLLLRAAALRGVTPDTPAYQQLERWLIEPPSDDVLAGSLRALHLIVGRSLPSVQDLAGRTIIDYCVALVRLTGGLHGLEPVVLRKDEGSGTKET